MFGTLNTILAHIVDGDEISDRVFGILVQKTGMLDDMWFVACLFTMEIIFYIVQHVSKSTAIAMFISLVISILGNLYIVFIGITLPWQLEKACVLVVFLAFGYYLKHIEKEENYILKSFIKKIVSPTKIICILISLLYIILLFGYDNPINIYGEKYGVYILFLSTSIIGLLMIISISRYIEKNVNKNIIYYFIIYVGKNTLIYYALQSKMIR